MSVKSKQSINISYKLSDLAEILSAKLVLNGASSDHEISGIATLKNANCHQLSFFTNNKYRDDVKISKAGVVITSPKFSDQIKSAGLIINNPYYAYAKLTRLFIDQKYYPNKIDATDYMGSVHETAIIGKNCSLSKSAIIGPYVVIGDNVEIADKVVIKSHCTIGDSCSLGANTLLYDRVTLYSNVTLGENCIIHSGAVIGSDGFGFANTSERSWFKVEQLGGVTIGNDVEIGANTTIDCGALDNTIISDGVKLDNQIQVGHNVQIGKHSAFAAKTAIAGSSKIGNHCGVGGMSTIAGHVELADGVNLAGACVVTKSIDKPGIYGGGTGHVMPFNKWTRFIVNIAKLDKYLAQIKQLRAELKAGVNQKKQS